MYNLKISILHGKNSKNNKHLKLEKISVGYFSQFYIQFLKSFFILQKDKKVCIKGNIDKGTA